MKTTFSDRAIMMKFLCAAKSSRPYEYKAYMIDIRVVSQEAFNYTEAIGR